MFPDPLPLLRTGVVGNFQTLVDPPLGAHFDGHIHLGPEGAAVAMLAGTRRRPGSHVARGPDEQSDRLRHHGSWDGSGASGLFNATSTPGDARAEVVRWNASNLLINAPYDEVNDDTVAATKLFYLGLGSWSGRTEHVDEPFNEDGVSGWRIEVRSEQERAVAINDDFELTVEHGWTLTGPPDNRSLNRPLKIGVRSAKRRPLSEHIVRLDAVHALLSVAHWKPVTAATGVAQLDPGSRRRAVLWDDTMTNDLVEPRFERVPDLHTR